MISSPFGSEIVNIFVGPDKQLFRAHRAIMSNASPYFAAIFNGNFKEGVEGCLELPEEKPEIFAVIIKSIYQGSLDSNSLRIMLGDYSDFHVPYVDSDNDDNDAAADIVRNPDILHDPDIRVYLSTDKYQLTGFKNAVMDLMRDEMGKRGQKFEADAIRYIYDNTLQRSPPRIFLVRKVAHDIVSDAARLARFEEVMESYHRFALDLVNELRKGSTIADPCHGCSEDYHESVSSQVQGNQLKERGFIIATTETCMFLIKVTGLQ